MLSPLPTVKRRPKRRPPARSQISTVPSRLAVYRVLPSSAIWGENALAVWPVSVSAAAAARTSQSWTSPSSPAVTRVLPSGVNAASLTALR